VLCGHNRSKFYSRKKLLKEEIISVSLQTIAAEEFAVYSNIHESFDNLVADESPPFFLS
jgi:hypothetical protein